MRMLHSRAFVFAAGIAVGILLSILMRLNNSPSPNSNASSETPTAHDDKALAGKPCVAENSETAGRDPDALAKEPTDGLKAPRFKAEGVIKSTLEGFILVRWTEVPGAEKYEVTVTDGAGNPERTFETKHTYTYLKNLKVNPRLRETPYRVRVVPFGEENKKGKESEWKKLAMLPMKDLAPPTIKSITTED